MQGLSEEQHSRMSEEDMEKLDRTFATEPITRISRILEEIPRLRELLDDSYHAYELPEYVMVETNGAEQEQSDQIVDNLTDSEMNTLKQLVRTTMEQRTQTQPSAGLQ